jgi:pyruvate/2-oxoglutarate dehydrogenase complex dihydrolipoamide acyltransferase (E2) component
VRIEVVVPQVGEVGQEVTFARWLRAEGDLVAEGDAIFEVETEKSTVEVQAFASGRLTDLQVHDGDVVEPLQVVAVLVPAAMS